MKDLIIIGAGPAGITAAVYAARKKMDFMVISRDIGGQTAWSGEVENYTGYQYISGPELAIKFREHMEKYKFEMLEGEGISIVERASDNSFKVKLESGKEYFSKTIILASGKRPRLLNIPGEAKYKNKGLAFCTTCDGPLFANKVVAVIGGGNSALDSLLQMSKIASKVYAINITDSFTGDGVMVDKVIKAPNVEILHNAKTLEILGDKFVSGIKIQTGEQVREIALNGVFVEIGLVPNSSFIDFVEKNDHGEIKINCSAETSIPGVFAAGDVTAVPAKQIIIAAGDGAKAAMSAFDYLAKH